MGAPLSTVSYLLPFIRRCAVVGGSGSQRDGRTVRMPSAAVCWLLLATAAIADANSSPNSTVLSPDRARHDTRCGADCARCAPDGCLRCVELLVSSTRQCVKACPSATHETWATGDRLMGRVCYPDGYYNEAILGGCAGAALCIILVIIGVVYVRCRRRQPRGRPLPLSPPPDQESARLREFHKQLDCLRPHAFTLLSILNNTRRQVRELYLLGNNDAAMAYSCVLSDLAKLLILLNKSHVPVVPEEWPRLASWAERVLKRYAPLTAGGQQQMNQLVNFLQTPVTDAEQPQFSTFKPPSYASSSVYSDDIFDKEFDVQWTDDLRPPSYSLIEREAIPLANPWTRGPVMRRESVWIEDEELKLARPQDELTTEL